VLTALPSSAEQSVLDCAPPYVGSSHNPVKLLKAHFAAEKTSVVYSGVFPTVMFKIVAEKLEGAILIRLRKIQ